MRVPDEDQLALSLPIYACGRGVDEGVSGTLAIKSFLIPRVRVLYQLVDDDFNLRPANCTAQTRLIRQNFPLLCLREMIFCLSCSVLSRVINVRRVRDCAWRNVLPVLIEANSTSVLALLFCSS